MFGILFGWRKACKCKKQIRWLQRRLRLLMNKRGSMVRQSRQDVAQLIKLGCDEPALEKAELLFRDESLMAVYELLDHFCEFILIHMPYIRRNKDFPNDINEAVSSLIYASARCGDLPELLVIRELFGQRYGQKFATAAVELLPGNLVNPQLKEHLNVQSVPKFVKRKLVDEITQDYCLQPEILAIEYPSELIEDNTHKAQPIKNFTDQIKESQVPVSNSTATDRKSVYIDSSSSSINYFRTAAHSPQGSETSSTPVAFSIAHQSSPGASESPDDSHVDEVGKHDKRGKSTIFDYETKDIQRKNISNITNSESKEDRMTSSSSEFFVQFPEETVSCLDDVEEYQSFVSNTRDIQDQRLFKFKSCMPQKIRTSTSCDGHSDGDEYHRDEEQTSFRRKGRSCVERSVSGEIYFMNDIDCAFYYDELSIKNSAIPKHQHSHKRKLRRMSTPPMESEHFRYSPKQEKQRCCIDTGTLLRQNSDTKNTLTIRSYPAKQTQDKEQGIHTLESFSSCPMDHCEFSKSSTREELQRTYMRARTIAVKRNIDCSRNKIVRSNRVLSLQPNHVHPKLPDYDDLAAKFLAFRK